MWKSVHSFLALSHRCRLAVFAPWMGIRSETFIRRHMNSILPGETAAISYTSLSGLSASEPEVGGPQLILDRLIVPVFGVPLLKQGRAVRLVKRFLRAHGVEVFLGEYLDVSLDWLEIAAELNIRYFAHAHGYDVSRRLRDPTWESAYRRYNGADGVITVSEYSRDKLVSVGIDAAKISVIPCGVDVPTQPEYHRCTDTVRCIAVGRMVSKKAPILVLDAFRRALSECPRLRLDFVGEGDLLPAARQFIQAFDLGERVVLHGGTPHTVVHSLMLQSDIFVQHSITVPETGDQEGLPVSILEAMAHSLPIVSTRHAGIPEAVVHGENGFLVEEGDTVGMARYIINLARDEQLRCRVGQAGWLRAKGQFAWDRERLALLKLFNL